MTERLIGIGEAADRTGVAVSTLRYWEQRGLVRPAERRGRRRRYGPDELHRIGLVKLWQDTGLMSLEEIAAVFAGTAADHEWRAVVLDRIRAIDEQQQRLATGRANLEHLLTCPDTRPADRCPSLREATTRWMAAADGPADGASPPWRAGAPRRPA